MSIRVLFFRYQAPFFRYRDPFFGYLDPFFGHRVPFFRYRAPFFGYLDPFFGHIVPFFGYQAPFIGYLDPFYGYRAPFIFCPFSCIFLSLLTRGHYYNLGGIRSSRRKLLNERDRRPIWGCWRDLERMRSRARARNTSADTVSHKFCKKSEEHQLVYCCSTFAIHITLCISVAILE